jgi:hypothetical protein
MAFTVSGAYDHSMNIQSPRIVWISGLGLFGLPWTLDH